jgi:CubicO group peptidase (beta-lactamase class C family)
MERSGDLDQNHLGSRDFRWGRGCAKIPRMRLPALALSIPLLALIGCAPRPARNPIADAGAGDLAATLRPIRERAGLPALAAAIVTTRAVEHIGIVGVRKWDDPTPATLDDAFHLGSDTKAMTGVLVGYAVDRGKVSWTTTVAEVFPEWASEMDPAYRSVTLDQLLAHRGGFPHDSWPSGSSFSTLHALPGTPREQRSAYVRMALRTPPEAAPGTKQVYSNMGFTVAGAMLERRLDTSWEELIASVLFGPLGMKGAGFGAMGHAGRVDALWQHLPRGTTPVEPGPMSDNPLAIGPAGTVHVTIDGWGHFIKDQLLSFDGHGAVLKPETYEHLHTPLFGGTYVAGWGIVQRPWAGGDAFTHAGSNTQNMAIVWMAPRRRFAVLIATNVGGEAAARACNEVAVALLHLAQETASAEPVADVGLDAFWSDWG